MKLGLDVTLLFQKCYKKLEHFFLYIPLNLSSIWFSFNCREEFLEKIQRRVKDYEIKVLNEPRPDKKLLVLDIDYTLFGKNLTVISSKIFIPQVD